jgi:hypothetical protein
VWAGEVLCCSLTTGYRLSSAALVLAMVAAGSSFAQLILSGGEGESLISILMVMHFFF